MSEIVILDRITLRRDDCEKLGVDVIYDSGEQVVLTDDFVFIRRLQKCESPFHNYEHRHISGGNYLNDTLQNFSLYKDLLKSYRWK